MNSQLNRQFGTCIRSLRLEAGMSQAVFGEKCGFYQTYLSRIETGRANPTLNAIEVIANTLGMSVFELFDRVKEMRRQGEVAAKSPKKGKKRK